MENTTKTNKNALTAEQRAEQWNEMLTAFGRAYTTGGDYYEQLQAIATAVALSTVHKCADPQRKTAVKRNTVSTTGQNPVMLDLQRGIMHDNALLRNTATAALTATKLKPNTKNGEYITITANKDSNKALGKLISETLTDGIDLVQEACLAILEQAEQWADTYGEQFLTAKVTKKEINRRVIIKEGAEMVEIETAPIVEVYRAVRRAIMSSRAVQTDPRSGYLYLEELYNPETGEITIPDIRATADGLETVYIRLPKYVDLAGSVEYHRDGVTATADPQTVTDYNAIMARLELSERAERVIMYRMQGYGNKAIATRMGVDVKVIKRILQRLQKQCKSIGFTPGMWLEMTESSVKI